MKTIISEKYILLLKINRLRILLQINIFLILFSPSLLKIHTSSV